MKSMRILPVVAFFALMAGCATTFRPWLLSEIQEGMIKALVVGILGQPDSSEMRNGAEYLLYTYQEGYNPAPANSPVFEPDAVQRMRDAELARSFREYRYEVMLVDGKVVNYKEL